MKTQLIAGLIITALIVGCRQRESGVVISVGVFSPIEKNMTPTLAELICLKAYAESIYNPEQRPTLVDEGELKRLGYSLRLASSNHLKPGSQRLFNQGIPEEGGSLALCADTQSIDKGGYELSVNFGTGPGKVSDSTEQSVFVGVPSVGSLILSNGLVVTWATEPRQE